MQNLTLDIDMKDLSVTSTTIDQTDGTFPDDDMRSPRTPTYVPTSPDFSKLTAFDTSRIFASPETTTTENPISTPLEPERPLAWIWQCHLCKCRYPLNVTRRCLHDGHFYCSGETGRPNLKKKKCGQSCSSEFDYIGWREWGEWKRKVLGKLESGAGTKLHAKGCQNCEFPSQCRYASGRVSPKGTVSPVACESDLSLPPGEEKKPRFYIPEGVTFDSILASGTVEQNEVSKLNRVDLPVDTDTDTLSLSTEPPAILERIVKSAEQRSSRRSTLSPIAEEFFSKGDLIKSSFADIALQSWNDIGGKGKRNRGGDRMNFI